MADEQNRTLTDKFMLRLPDGMRDRVRVAAAANGRSMNSEIIAALLKEYPDPEMTGDLLTFIARWMRENAPLSDPSDASYPDMLHVAADIYFRKIADERT